ncbi:ATP-binding cassette domain-containing protein [Halomonas sp. E19]|uniref:ATP-binding cassette domain-containing protein n=1 Tax=Halomonas sp. E19 TaxID=3397247 RepID=UPI004034D61C
MIDVRNVYKRYHGHHGSQGWVLEDINFSIPQGISVGMLGRNGAGKSTLLRLIGGMDTPDRGEIRHHCRVSWPIGLGGGFQGSMTGRQNVKFVARVHGGEHEIPRVTRFVEEFAEIGPAFDRPVRTYSSGMRSRLAFGLSLAFDFDVYLSDEATSVGDAAFKAKATQAFKDRVGKASIVMVSHSVGILRDLCQAGVWLDKGKATWYDDIEEAIDAYHASIDKPPSPKGQGSRQACENPARTNSANAASQEQRLMRSAKTLLRRHPYWVVALLFILGSTLYWAAIASDRYVSESHIVLDSPEVRLDSFNIASLMSGAAGAKDLLLLRDHLRSVDMLRKLDAALDLRNHYAQAHIDPLSRLSRADVPMEKFHRYYLKRVEVIFDEYASVLRIRAQAYDPETAQAIANLLLQEGERHMNDMGQRLAEEQVRFIEGQVAALEARLFEHRDNLLAFQNEHGMVSPTGTVQSRSEVIARLEGELAVLSARQSAMSNYQSERSAEMLRVGHEIRALEQQVERERARLANNNGALALNRLSAEFETLRMRAEFATELYATAIAALESTRVEAARKMKQVSVLQMPTLPEYSQQPRRLYNITLYALLALLAAVIAHLMAAIVRDHKD